jgi:AcrR family transcriptional regulator
MNNKNKILTAAIEVFGEKGKHGARMEEIATRAKINKAMVYYYYNSRDNLYREALKQVFLNIHHHFASDLKRILPDSITYEKKLELLTRSFFRLYKENPDMTKLFLLAFTNEPETVVQAITQLRTEVEITNPQKMMTLLEAGKALDIYRDVDPSHTILSIIGINLAHFIAAPVIKSVLSIDSESRQEFHKIREKNIVDLVLYGLIRTKV